MESNLKPNCGADETSTFEDIYDYYFDDLVIFAFRFTQDINSAQDIVQEVIVKMWEKRDKLSTIDNLKGYLIKSVQNKAYNYIRDNKGVETFAELILFEKNNESYTDNSMIFKDLEDRLEQVLQALPEQTAAIFKRVRLEGEKYKVVADEFDMTTKGVEFHMAKAMKQLNNKLKPHFLFFLITIFENLN